MPISIFMVISSYLLSAQLINLHLLCVLDSSIYFAISEKAAITPRSFCFPVNKLCWGPEDNGASRGDWHQPGLLIRKGLHCQLRRVHHGAIVLRLPGQEHTPPVTFARWADCSSRLDRVALLSIPDSEPSHPNRQVFRNCPYTGRIWIANV